MKYLNVEVATKEDLRTAGVPENLIDTLLAGGPVFSVFADNELIYIGGLSIRWKGTADAWMRILGDFKKYINSPRIVRSILEDMMKAYKIKRVLMYADTTNETLERWAAWLKFEKMAVLDGFGPEGQDYIVFMRRA